MDRLFTRVSGKEKGENMQAQLAFKIAIFIVILSTAGYFFYDYRMAKANLEAKKAELVAVSLQIKEQNEKIEKMRLEIDTYKNKKPEIIKEIITKYKEIPVVTADATCEERWKNLEDYVKVFFNRHSGTNYIQTETTKETDKVDTQKTKEEIEALKIQNEIKAQEFVDKMLKRDSKGGN